MKFEKNKQSGIRIGKYRFCIQKIVEETDEVKELIKWMEEESK